MEHGIFLNPLVLRPLTEVVCEHHQLLPALICHNLGFQRLSHKFNDLHLRRAFNFSHKQMGLAVIFMHPKLVISSKLIRPSLITCLHSHLMKPFKHLPQTDGIKALAGGPVCDLHVIARMSETPV